MLISTSLGKHSMVLILVAVCAPACAANRPLAKMDPSLPIDTRDGFKQEGRDLDPEDMTKKLRERPASASQAKQARVLGTAAVVLAAAGGALVGWPLGSKIAGDDPNWTLAYAGAGAIVISIPLTLWSIGSLDGAIESHNGSLGHD